VNFSTTAPATVTIATPSASGTIVNDD
jgi:hypothetical protein